MTHTPTRDTDGSDNQKSPVGRELHMDDYSTDKEKHSGSRYGGSWAVHARECSALLPLIPQQWHDAESPLSLAEYEAFDELQGWVLARRLGTEIFSKSLDGSF